MSWSFNLLCNVRVVSTYTPQCNLPVPSLPVSNAFGHNVYCSVCEQYKNEDIIAVQRAEDVGAYCVVNLTMEVVTPVR
jgi:hypothetical protein